MSYQYFMLCILYTMFMSFELDEFLTVLLCFQLYSIMDMKPPISKAKMTAITRNAIKAIKLYKHVVQCVEKFIQKVNWNIYIFCKYGGYYLKYFKIFFF